jgi:hypothetical protein
MQENREFGRTGVLRECEHCLQEYKREQSAGEDAVSAGEERTGVRENREYIMWSQCGHNDKDDIVAA